VPTWRAGGVSLLEAGILMLFDVIALGGVMMMINANCTGIVSMRLVDGLTNGLVNNAPFPMLRFQAVWGPMDRSMDSVLPHPTRIFSSALYHG